MLVAVLDTARSIWSPLLSSEVKTAIKTAPLPAVSPWGVALQQAPGPVAPGSRRTRGFYLIALYPNFCPPMLASYINPPLATVKTAMPFW